MFYLIKQQAIQSGCAIQRPMNKWADFSIERAVYG